MKNFKNLLLIFLSLLMKSFKETCHIRRYYAMIRPIVILPTDIHSSQLNTRYIKTYIVAKTIQIEENIGL